MIRGVLPSELASAAATARGSYAIDAGAMDRRDATRPQVDEENWQTGELLEKVLTHGLGTRAAAAAAPRPAARDDASGAAYAALDAGRPPPAPLLRPVAGPKEECVIV